ncbi:hypothetical protein PUN28_007129 [Cardiocondyla obscurior]
MQLAIIKKKQCDTKALAIVEQLLESHVDPDWLLQNLGFISKSHMEDVIEERAIVKLCGYILCSNQLTVVIRQQYHISTRKNKVYDISRRKNFCSSSCYGAANYILEQMLESPLWMREKEDIPSFQILPLNSKSVLCGDEVDVGIKLSQSSNSDYNDDSKEFAGRNAIEQTEENVMHTSRSEKEKRAEEISTDIQESFNYKMHLSELCEQDSKKCDLTDCINQEVNYGNNIKQVDINQENLEIEISQKSENFLHLHKHKIITKDINVDANICDNKKALQLQLNEIECNRNDTDERLPQSIETSNRNDENEKGLLLLDEVNSPRNEKAIAPQLDKVCSNNNTAISSSSVCDKYKVTGEANKINTSKKCNLKKTNNSMKVQSNIYHNLAMHVEQSVREWITKNTICLLTGQADERSQLIEKLTQYDRYQKLCKKLNKLQVQDAKEDRIKSEEKELKPLPHFSVLQEEGKKIELKVRAFYDGQMTFTQSEDSIKESESKSNVEPVLPLTDFHAPNALRRRIFLENLDKILPDLMRALTPNANISSLAQCTNDNERYSLIKILVSTFHLSAGNIVFKSAEWTLVGLIIIKMLSLIDVKLQLLLRSKQASMYTSMILTTYKLDSNYLDEFLMEITNMECTSKPNDNVK